MKFLHIKEKQPIEMYAIGDVHYGSNECMVEKFLKTIEEVKSKKNARVLLMGDLIDAALKNSPGAGPFENAMSPEQQLQFIIDALEPIKSKIYGVLNANHEERIYKNAGINVLKMLSRILDIPFLGNSVFAKIKVGKQNYSLFATHGASGSTTLSGKINTVMKFSNHIQADIYLMAHVHELAHHNSEYFYIDNGDKMIKKGVKHFVLTGHYLDYAGYAEQKGLKPGNTGSPIVKFDAKDKDIEVVL
jgi:hypothetical protein